MMPSSPGKGDRRYITHPPTIQYRKPYRPRSHSRHGPPHSQSHFNSPKYTHKRILLHSKQPLLHPPLRPSSSSSSSSTLIDITTDKPHATTTVTPITNTTTNTNTTPSQKRNLLPETPFGIPSHWTPQLDFHLWHLRGQVHQVHAHIQSHFRFKPSISKEWIRQRLQDTAFQQLKFLSHYLPGELGTISRVRIRAMILHGGHGVFFEGVEEDLTPLPPIPSSSVGGQGGVSIPKDEVGNREGYVFPSKEVLKEGMPIGWNPSWDRWLGEKARGGWMAGEVWKMMKKRIGKMEETNENANGNGNGNGNVKVEDMDENENGRLEGMENVKLELMDHAHSDVDVKLEPMEMEMEKVKTEEGWEIVGGGTLEELEMKDMDIHGGLVLPEGLTREWFERRMVLAGYLGLGIQGRGWDEEEKKENGIGNGEVVREEKEKEIKKEKVIIMLDD